MNHLVSSERSAYVLTYVCAILTCSTHPKHCRPISVTTRPAVFQENTQEQLDEHYKVKTLQIPIQVSI